MSRLIKPKEFFRAISDSPRLKFSLAWLTFVGLAVPVAALMSVGLPERYALPALLVLVVPFQYAIFCLWQKRREARAEEVRAPARFTAALTLQEALTSDVERRLRHIDAMVQLGRYPAPEVLLPHALVGSLASEQRAVLETLPNFASIVLADVMMPGVSGLELLRSLKRGTPSRPVILITAQGTIAHSLLWLKDKNFEESEENIEMQRQLLKRPPSSLPATSLVPLPI